MSGLACSKVTRTSDYLREGSRSANPDLMDAGLPFVGLLTLPLERQFILWCVEAVLDRDQVRHDQE